MTRPVRRPRADHAQVAARLREHPGVWMKVSTYPAGYLARDLARRINYAWRLPMYEPAGSFEAGAVQREDDDLVVARWIGDRANGTTP